MWLADSSVDTSELLCESDRSLTLTFERLLLYVVEVLLLLLLVVVVVVVVIRMTVDLLVEPVVALSALGFCDFLSLLRSRKSRT